MTWHVTNKEDAFCVAPSEVKQESQRAQRPGAAHVRTRQQSCSNA